MDLGHPFPDYRVPGLFLLIVLGIGMLVAGVVTLLRVRWWSVGALVMTIAGAGGV